MFTGCLTPQRAERKSKQARKRWLKHEYDLTPERFEDMKLRQRGVCPGCGKELSPENRPVPDHIAGTKIVRGVLCNHCNLTIGHAFDNPEVLRNLATYLERYI